MERLLKLLDFFAYSLSKKKSHAFIFSPTQIKIYYTEDLAELNFINSTLTHKQQQRLKYKNFLWIVIEATWGELWENIQEVSDIVVKFDDGSFYSNLDGTFIFEEIENHKKIDFKNSLHSKRNTSKRFKSKQFESKQFESKQFQSKQHVNDLNALNSEFKPKFCDEMTNKWYPEMKGSRSEYDSFEYWSKNESNCINNLDNLYYHHFNSYNEDCVRSNEETSLFNHGANNFYVGENYETLSEFNSNEYHEMGEYHYNQFSSVSNFGQSTPSFSVENHDSYGNLHHKSSFLAQNYHPFMNVNYQNYNELLLCEEYFNNNFIFNSQEENEISKQNYYYSSEMSPKFNYQNYTKYHPNNEFSENSIQNYLNYCPESSTRPSGSPTHIYLGLPKPATVLNLDKLITWWIGICELYHRQLNLTTSLYKFDKFFNSENSSNDDDNDQFLEKVWTVPHISAKFKPEDLPSESYYMSNDWVEIVGFYSEGGLLVATLKEGILCESQFTIALKDFLMVNRFNCVEHFRTGVIAMSLRTKCLSKLEKWAVLIVNETRKEELDKKGYENNVGLKVQMIAQEIRFFLSENKKYKKKESKLKIKNGELDIITRLGELLNMNPHEIFKNIQK